MKSSSIHLLLAVLLSMGAVSDAQLPPATRRSSASMTSDYPIRPVPFTDVHFNDAFWHPRIEVNRTVTIPFAFEKCEETGRMWNFQRAAMALRGEPFEDKKAPGYTFDDTDVYKVLEGAAYTLSVHPDPKLEAYLDKQIELIRSAQEPDGYLFTTRTMNPQPPHQWVGTERWMLEHEHSHELYNLGHLYEAAVAHYQATGKRSLLDIAIKTADLLDATFGPGKRSIWPGHQITEMGLVKLYRATGDERYLKLAKFLLDERGPGDRTRRGSQYSQSHQKVTEQSEAVGHAVRATYMYAGMADVAALTGDQAYIDALDRIWNNVVGRKLYITGGIGATGSGEAFGRNYELPNMTAYNETCAAIGNAYWNHRLFLLHGDAKYMDVFERTLYNGLISGVSLDGKSFFYPNPLESKGQHSRSPWFGCACCPGNITRFMASVPGYVYAHRGDEVFVNLYVAGNAKLQLDDGRTIVLDQQTNYPWDGTIRIKVSPEQAGAFKVKLRIPGWALNQAVPSDLYRFVDPLAQTSQLSVNGVAMPLELDKGYAVLSREWTGGDVIELKLGMSVRRVAAHENVGADRGRVALVRGPITYCLEWPDNPDGKVRNLMLPDESRLQTEHRPDLLGGVTVIKGEALALSRDESGQILKKPQPFVAIPYATWANRGRGEMMVWIPNREDAARPLGAPTIASMSTIRTSGGTDREAITDQAEPQSSGDASSGFFHWWPKKGVTEWVEMTFAKPTRVSSTEIYWFDDTGRGECRIPASWKLLYRDGSEWKPVETSDEFGVAKDRFNTVQFQPVTTDALRLEVTFRPNMSAGIQEWKVE